MNDETKKGVAQSEAADAEDQALFDKFLEEQNDDDIKNGNDDDDDDDDDDAEENDGQYLFEGDIEHSKATIAKMKPRMMEPRMNLRMKPRKHP